MKTLFTLICAALMSFCCVGQETNQIKHPVEFQFNGGSLISFIETVKSSFGIDLNKVATLPGSMAGVMVPKLRLNARAFAVASQNRGFLSLADVLGLYNSISGKGDPSLGRWIMEAFNDGEPQTILLVATGPKSESSFAVRGFSLPTSNSDDSNRAYAILRDTIQSQQDSLMGNRSYNGLSEIELRGRLDIHPSSGILVASGGKIYVEMAGSIIEAYKEKLRQPDIPFKNRTTPQPQP